MPLMLRTEFYDLLRLKWRNNLLLTVLEITVETILIYYILVMFGFSALLLASIPDIVRSFKEGSYGNISELVNTIAAPPITVITPIYNEERRGFMLESVHAVLNSDYKNLRLILVNDGSKDNTLQLLIEKLDLYEIPVAIKQKVPTIGKIRHCYLSLKYSNITVIDKENGGAADANNVGINALVTPFHVTIDADTIIEPQTLSRLLFTYLSNENCIVVGGALFLLNGNKPVNGKMTHPLVPKRFVPSMQVPEFLRSFLYGRAGWDSLKGALCYAGALTFFETQKVIEAGGNELGNSAYDMEIILKLHDYMQKKDQKYTMGFAPNAYGWTEQPSTIKQYWRQRNIWQRGSMRSLFKYWYMLFNPNYGIIGFVTYPFYLIFEVFAGVVETTAYLTFILAWYLQIPNFIPLSVLFIISAWGFLVLLTVACSLINIVTFDPYRRILDTLRIICLTSIEMVGFRQFHAICRATATFQYFFNRARGKKL